MSNPEPPERDWARPNSAPAAPPPGPPPVANADAATPPAPPDSSQDRPRRNGLIVALSVVCAALLLTTVGFGASTLWLSSTSAAGTADPTPAPTSSGKGTSGVESKPQKVQGFDVTVVSDIPFGPFAMTATDKDGYTSLYAKIKNDDPALAAEVYFDITAYGPDGRVVGRTPSNTYLLPGHQSLFYGIIASDMSQVDRIKIEQTKIDREPPVVTGTIVLDEVRGGEGVVEGTFTSSLSALSEYATVYLAGFVDGELFAACSDSVDIPASGGTFTARCRLQAASTKTPKPITEFPDDVVFDAYLAPDIP